MEFDHDCIIINLNKARAGEAPPVKITAILSRKHTEQSNA